jgi:Protein kinase domain
MGSRVLVLFLDKVSRAGFAHCNVCAANITWHEANSEWRLTDLAHGFEVEGQKPISLACHSLRTAAPELVEQADSGEERLTVLPESDSWSLGILAVELVTGRPLFFPELTKDEVIDMLVGRAQLPWEGTTVRAGPVPAIPEAVLLARAMSEPVAQLHK